MSSDRVIQPEHDRDEVHEKSLQPFQSAWMSHWTPTRHGRPLDDSQKLLTFPRDSGKTSNGSKRQSSLCETQIEAGSSKFVKEFREMRKVATINESSSAKKSRHETSSKEQQQFPMFKSSQNSDGNISMRNGKSFDHQIGSSRSLIGPTSANEDSASQTDKHSLSMHELIPSKVETQTESQDIISNPSQKVRSNKLLEEHRIVISAPLKEEYLGATSRIVPEFNSGRTPNESFLCRKGSINQSSSTFLVHERNINNNAALCIEDPSTSDSRLRGFLGQKIPKMPSLSDFKLFHSQKRASEAKLYHKLPRIPSFEHDVETMRICSTVGSVEELTISPPNFSQTTHFLITKKTDVSLSNEGEPRRKSTISDKFEDPQPGGFLGLSPDFGFDVKQGVKLQPLDSSTDSETKENVEKNRSSEVDLKNESSAETATMDMDTFRVNHLSGVVSSISNKGVDGGQESQTLEAATASVKEQIGYKLPDMVLPDIKQEARAAPGIATSADEEEESTSKTQSLDVEHLLPHVDHPENSKSGACADTSLGLDPYSRWFKRLRPSASDAFALGTKSMQMDEAASHEKVNRFFSKVLNNNKTSSETKINQSFGKRHMMADRALDLPRNVTPPSTNSGTKNQDITLSHAWVQRWCHNQAESSEKKPETSVVHELSSKANEDDFSKQQFPSIAAMALMGKAMNGFHPCEFRKRGSFVVWNTKR